MLVKHLQRCSNPINHYLLLGTHARHKFYVRRNLTHTSKVQEILDRKLKALNTCFKSNVGIWGEKQNVRSAWRNI